jgi:hypothetical protein
MAASATEVNSAERRADAFHETYVTKLPAVRSGWEKTK